MNFQTVNSSRVHIEKKCLKWFHKILAWSIDNFLKIEAHNFQIVIRLTLHNFCIVFNGIMQTWHVVFPHDTNIFETFTKTIFNPALGKLENYTFLYISHICSLSASRYIYKSQKSLSWVISLIHPLLSNSFTLMMNFVWV